MIQGTSKGLPAQKGRKMKNLGLLKLQNGSDVRGVAVDGIPEHPLTLTEEAVLRLSASFACWLARKKGRPATGLRIAVGGTIRG